MYHVHSDFWRFQYSSDIFIMTFLNSRYWMPYLAYLFISSFPNFLNLKGSVQSFHVASPPNYLHLRTLRAACCPKTQVLQVPHWAPGMQLSSVLHTLSIPGPTQPTWGTGVDHWVPWPLGLRLLLWCYLGLLIFKWPFIPVWQEEHTRKQQREQMLSVLWQENYAGQP